MSKLGSSREDRRCVKWEVGSSRPDRRECNYENIGQHYSVVVTVVELSRYLEIHTLPAKHKLGVNIVVGDPVCGSRPSLIDGSEEACTRSVLTL